jgi:hypothetical protein
MAFFRSGAFMTSVVQLIELDNADKAIVINGEVAVAYEAQNEDYYEFDKIAQTLAAELGTELQRISLKAPRQTNWHWNDVLQQMQ